MSQKNTHARLNLRHVKGFSCKRLGSVVASPSSEGLIYYAAGRNLVAMKEDDPLKQDFMCGHKGNITCIAVSADGSMIATGCEGRASDVVVWDAASRAEKFRFCEHDHCVSCLAFSADSRLLLSIGNSRDRKAFVWDVRTGCIIASSQVPLAMNNDPNTAAACAWAPGTTGNGHYLAGSVGSPDVHLWSLDPYRGILTPERVLPGSVARKYTTARFSKDHQWLFAGSASGDVVVVNVARKNVQLSHPVCSLGVGAVIEVGSNLLVGGGDGSLTLLRPEETRSAEKPRTVLPGGVTSLTRSAEGRALIAGTDHGRIVRIEEPSMRCSVISASHESAVRAAAFRGDRLVTCSEDGSIRVWDTETMELRAQIDNPSRRGGTVPLCVMVTEDGEVLSGWSDGQLWCHDLRGGCRWHIHGVHASPRGEGVTAVCVSHSGEFIATGGIDGDIRVWDRSSREVVSHMTQHKEAVCDLQVFKDDMHVVSGSRDGTFIIWDVFQENRISCHVCPTGGFTGLQLSSDQVQVVTVGMDRKLQFWDVRHQVPTQVIDKAHDEVCTAVAISPSLMFIADLSCSTLVTLLRPTTSNYLLFAPPRLRISFVEGRGAPSAIFSPSPFTALLRAPFSLREG
uniref:Wd40 repeat protein n=2 Tax=Tetraselmis sp. GSL018 TaxID=582737 RepID=A0A061RFE0_9CHLO